MEKNLNWIIWAVLSISQANAGEVAKFVDVEAIAKASIAPLIENSPGSGRYVGVWVGIISPNGRYTKGFGETKLGSGIAPNDSTIFEIGSITKTFTGILLAMSGLDINKKAQDFLPPGVRLPQVDGISIQLKDLVTHTSGLPSVPPGVTSVEEFLNYSPSTAYAFLSAAKLGHSPARTYEYSNLGMGLLAHILEGADSDEQTTRFEHLVTKITAPLGLSDTVVFPNEEQKTRLSCAYDRDGLEGANWNWGDNSINAGAGALKSTGRDMMKYLEANLGLTSSSIDSFIKKSHEKLFQVSDHVAIGYAWHQTPIDSDRIIWHNGGTSGFQSFLGFIEKKGVGVVILANTMNYTQEQQVDPRIDKAASEILKQLQ